MVELGVGLVPRSGFGGVGRSWFVTFVVVSQLAEAVNSYAIRFCLTLF